MSTMYTTRPRSTSSHQGTAIFSMAGVYGRDPEIDVKDSRVEVLAPRTKPNPRFTLPSDPRRIVKRRMTGESL